MGVAPSWGDQIVWGKRFYHASALASPPAQSASGTLRQPPLIESWRLVEPKNGKSYAIELLHPMREGRSPTQIGKKGQSNHRWIVGGKLCFILNQWGLICAWDCATANVYD